MRRAIILVMDSFGIGATADAERFGDTGADTLGSIARERIDALLDAGAAIHAYDPVAGKKLTALYGDRIKVGRKNYDVLENADGLVICTEWNEFRALDLARLSGSMKTARMADLRNIYSEDEALAGGFERYVSVGR